MPPTERQRDTHSVLKIALLVSGRMLGGGQRVVMDLKAGFAAQTGFQVEIWLLGDSSGMRGVGDAVMDYDGRYNTLRTLRSSVCQLRALVRSRRPDVIHSHGWDADLIAGLGLAGLQICHLVHLHVLPPPGQRAIGIRQSIRRLLSRRTLASAAATLSVSNAVADAWATSLGLPRDSIQALANGIDTHCFQPSVRARLDAGSIVLGVASRLVERKGLEDVLLALSCLLGRGHDVRLRIAGDGHLLPMLSDQSERLGIGARVTWLGQVEDMVGFYHAVDVYLQGSYGEGMPLALLEAMACGVPAVATAVGGTAEVLEDGVQGLLIEPGSPEAMANAVEALIENRSRLKAMGEAARRRIVGGFDLSVACASLAEIYLRLRPAGVADE